MVARDDAQDFVSDRLQRLCHFAFLFIRPHGRLEHIGHTVPCAVVYHVALKCHIGVRLVFDGVNQFVKLLPRAALRAQVHICQGDDRNLLRLLSKIVP